MTIDISAWNINDLEWKRMREKQWPFFERWFLLRNESYEREKKGILKECLINVKRFYDEGFLDEKIENPDRDWPTSVGFWNALPLYPNLTPSAFRELLNYSGFKKYSLKGSFGAYYLMRSPHLDLIEAGVLPESYVLVLMEGAYGHSMDEAGEILGFDPKTKYLEVFKTLGEKLFGYFYSGESEAMTYDIAIYMLPFYLDALSMMTNEEAHRCDFDFRSDLKTKRIVYGTGAVTDAKQLSFMESLLGGIQSRLDVMAPYTRENMLRLLE